MLKYITLFFILFTFQMIQCMGQTGCGKPVMKPEEILKSQQNFITGYYPALNFDESFNAIDENSEPIGKDVFFKKLLTGLYLPLKLSSAKLICYQLYKMDTSMVDESITGTIKILAYYAYENFKMEGKSLPTFDFTDLNNVEYNTENIKGKVVVIKTWFIHCQRCVEEMPYWIKIGKGFKKRSDIIFLSLALDKEDSLRHFLSKQKINCSVVADMKGYIADSLKIKSFPTYLLINREGKIVKVVGDVYTLKIALRKEVMK